MIWICTISLLALAAWLFFNALNERRWVQAHSHDEAVASDEGLLANFTMRTGTGAVGPDGKMSIYQEDSRFARAVSKVQEKTAGWEGKLEAKVKQASNLNSKNPDGTDRDETLVARASRQVSTTSEEISRRVASGAKNLAGTYEEKRAAVEGSSVFGKVLGKVSGSMEKLESTLGTKVARPKAPVADEGDLVTRAASKVDKKVNELGDRNTADKVD